MNIKLIPLIIVLLIAGCKKEESASDILNTVAIPPKEKVVAPKPVEKKPIEPLKTIAPSPSIKEVVKIVPTEPLKQPIPEVIAKPTTIDVVKPIPVITTPPKPIQQPVIQPVVKAETPKPIINKEDSKKGEVIMSIEFE